jgi:hypothetical protein
MGSGWKMILLIAGPECPAAPLTESVLLIVFHEDVQEGTDECERIQWVNLREVSIPYTHIGHKHSLPTEMGHMKVSERC